MCGLSVQLSVFFQNIESSHRRFEKVDDGIQAVFGHNGHGVVTLKPRSQSRQAGFFGGLRLVGLIQVLQFGGLGFEFLGVFFEFFGPLLNLLLARLR